jgi:type IV fimbrial biogenesis protein FimT
MLMRGTRRQRGLNLIELMVVITILGALLAAGLPLIASGARDSRLRGAAESIVSGLRIAQSESLKRNGTFRFQMVTNLADDCAVSSTGGAWVVSRDAATAKCHLTDPMSDPFTLRRDTLTGDVAVTADSTGAFCFSGLGRPTTGPAGCNDALAQSIEVKQAGGTCAADGGDARCLRVLVTTSGAVRMCDPAVNSLQDPRRC